MLSYTITSPLVNGTSYSKTNSGSGSFAYSNSNVLLDETHERSARGGANNYNFSYAVSPNGAESQKRNESGSETASHTRPPNGSINIFGYDTETVETSDSYSITPDGILNSEQGNTRGFTGDGDEWLIYADGDLTYKSINGGFESYHVMAGLTAPPIDSNGNDIEEAAGPPYSRSTRQDQLLTQRYFVGNYPPYSASHSEKRYFNTIRLQTTTATTQEVWNYRQTTTIQKIAKMGTTAASGTITIPTTTNAKSWTETSTTQTNSEIPVTVITTSMGIDSYWKKTSHTIVILKGNETFYALKNDAQLNASNGGVTDAAFWGSTAGPATFTITRAPHTTSESVALDGSITDTGYTAPEGVETETTITGFSDLTVQTTVFFGPNLPLQSYAQSPKTSFSISSTEQVIWSQPEGAWQANAKTTSRSVFGGRSVSFNIAGQSWSEQTPTFTTKAYQLPLARFESGSGSYDAAVSQDDFGEDENGNETFNTYPIEGVTGGGTNASASGESGNYFVWKYNSGAQPPLEGYNAKFMHAWGWGTLGDSTAAAFQSVSIGEVQSSDSLTWEMARMSQEVNTPFPKTSVSSKTSSNKTEATTYKIWGDGFSKTTSSANSSTGSSGSTSAKVSAGGAAITSFDMGGVKGWNISLAKGWIPSPQRILAGGIAPLNESTAIIPAGEYVGTTLSQPLTLQGSSIAPTFYELKPGGLNLVNDVGNYYSRVISA